MKRTSAAILLLAGLGGGCVSTSDKTNLAPEGARPFNKATLSSAVAKAKDAMPAMPSVSGVRQASSTGAEAPVVRADAVGTIDNMVAPAAGMVRVNGMANAAGWGRGGNWRGLCLP